VIPKEYRARCWKILLEYVPNFPELEESSLKSKRLDYTGLKDLLWEKIKHEEISEKSNQDDYKLRDNNYFHMNDQIIRDVNRTQAETG